MAGMPPPDDFQPSLFEEPLDRHEQFMQEAARLAAALPATLRFGTSSWTYPGWSGMVYRRSYPKTGATAPMLAEYARCPLFRTVGVDSFFYRPPTPEVLEEYRHALPAGFPLVMKVWDQITSYALNSPRHHMLRQLGVTPLQPSDRNPDWLNPTLCVDAVIGPALEYLGEHAGVFLFEFEAIPRSAHLTVAGFAEHLDRFFGALPKGPRYAVEIRTPQHLAPPYFAALRAHQVAHVFNAWTHMPTIGAQLLHDDALTTDFTIARALLRPGRTFNDAVEAFAPYDRIQDAFPEGHDDILTLIDRALAHAATIFVIANNRFEGSSPLTIANLARRFLLR
ncbi:MAG TPA: DUF72 domain-containing protein [Gemmatimonas aurantiaca]|uniref:DUF72 domain-containing protein n=3 Tax=Gemmatimonas aurantiaca TaxID=173480 RepID=C1A5K9_GEMAT|nr:hypothetical protein GAU_0477 [Gemmatimonas aurantiaca T-27]HCT58551.1 DUF72 domain-containing protein [Gemmatimonas aurantiaca]